LDRLEQPKFQSSPVKEEKYPLSQNQEDYVIHDNGGSRTGKNRRQNTAPYVGRENRYGKDRRAGEIAEAVRLAAGSMIAAAAKTGMEIWSNAGMRSGKNKTVLLEGITG
jgi:hypothetical protein